MNELQVEERCSELEERGLVECFGVGVGNHVFGADPDWDGEEGEELFAPDVHPTFEVSVSCSGSDVVVMVAIAAMESQKIWTGCLKVTPRSWRS